MKYPIDVEKYIAAMRIEFGPNEGSEEVYRIVIPAVNDAYQDGTDGASGYPWDTTGFIEKSPVSRRLISATSKWVNEAYKQGRQDAQKAVRV